MPADTNTQTILASSNDGRFLIVQSEPWMAPQLEAIQQASFPELAFEELMHSDHYKAHMQVFPEGQHAVLERSSNKVIAASSDLKLEFDPNHYQHKYIEAVGHNYFTTHQPDANWLYGADIGVLPDFRGFGLSKLLYTARQDMVRRLGLKGHFAGAMPKGYGAHSSEMSIEQYVQQVVRGELNDPVLSIQLRRGYAVWGIIPDYLEDASCANYGVQIVWRNPDVR
jgi:GNAT superfamily N-acetyltransferase